MDKHGSGWADPTNEKVWDYNIPYWRKPSKLGFQGIQLGYIRFPSDQTDQAVRVLQNSHNKKTAAVKTLEQFLERAHKRAQELGVELSIDVFGLTGSSDDDISIGLETQQSHQTRGCSSRR